MDTQLDKFFNELQRIAERLMSTEDNEAIRHDLLVRPILTSPLGLGWEAGEVLSQVNMPVEKLITDSYYWRGAIPRKRRPDIVLVPYNVAHVVGIVEEKKRHARLHELESHTGQLLEYQYLHRCVWGLLTDGEKWILTKNHEIFHRFESLSDLKSRIKDLKHCIGRDAILARIRQFGTTDLVYVRPAHSVLILGFPGAQPSVTNLHDFLKEPSTEGQDLVAYLFRSIRNEVFQSLDEMNDLDARSFLASFFGSGFSNYATPVVGFSQLLLEGYADKKEEHEVKADYARAVHRWVEKYPVFQNAFDQFKSGVLPSPSWLIDLCIQTDYFLPLFRLSPDLLREAEQWARSIGAPKRALKFIEEAILTR